MGNAEVFCGNATTSVGTAFPLVPPQFSPLTKKQITTNQLTETWKMEAENLHSLERAERTRW